MSVIMRTDVTAVKLYNNFIFAGIGSFVHIFDKKSAKLIHKIHGLRGQKIYGFVSTQCESKVVVFGGKQFTVIAMKTAGESTMFERLFEPVICDDWLHSAVWIDYDIVALLSAHNVVQKWSTSNPFLVSESRSVDNSILYSGLLVRLDDADDVLVLAGTVSSEVIVHRFGGKALHHLKGHRGVIFSISYNQQKELIVTTSDDRSVRIWHIKNSCNHTNNTKMYWDSAEIVCLNDIYGHSARVMRNCITEHLIVSVGEDSVICYWDLKGNLLRKVTTHQNGCIWSIDADNDNLVTGGGDGGVIIHPLSVSSYSDQSEILNLDVIVPKKILFTARRNIVILNEASELIYYDFVAKSKMVYKLNHESTYKILSMSSCKQIIAVADMNGKLDVFVENCKDTAYLRNVIDAELEIGKILSMQWSGNRHLVICTEDGIITALASTDNKTEVVANFVLPKCKEKWLTAVAIDITQKVFVVGDRCGNVHVYCKGQKYPIKTFSNVHGRYGPTSINIKENEIISTGRDGTIKQFYMNKDLSEIKYMNCRELEFKWVEKFLDKNENLICGFHEKVFVIYDIKSNSKLLEIPCGGGHRSWDAVRYIEKNNGMYEEVVKLIYLKNAEIHLSTFEMSKIVSRNIVNGSHAKKINCLKSYKSDLDQSVTFYISGGEDTTLRISSVNAEKVFKDEIVFKQLSSIRTVKVYQLKDNKILVASAGGRAQICIKTITYERKDEVKPKAEILVDYRLKGLDKERIVNQNWRNSSVDFDPETRIMDIDVMKLNDGTFLFFAGCSDAYLRVFLLTLESKTEFKSIIDLKHHKTCILKTNLIKLNNKFFIVTCTTRGEITIWDIMITPDIANLEMEPIFTTSSNKSGINSFDSKLLSESHILIATGGDDNAIHLIVLEMTVQDKMENPTEIKVLHTWSTDKYHCSQVTGLLLLDDVLVTTGIDQRVTICKWRVDKEGIYCGFLSQAISDVADIQGMDVIKNDRDAVTVTVFGNGFEVITLEKNNAR